MNRFKILMAVLLAFVLSFPVEGAAAFANDDGIASGAAASGAIGDAADGATAITDPLTNRYWEGLLQKDTAYAGRIWTDKSVSADSILFDDYQGVEAGDSAFVTALSVFSYTSNLEGAVLQSDCVTFDDPLGAYMQVDDICAVVANGALYEQRNVTTDGNVTTYRFTGTATINGEQARLEDLVMTVTKSNDAAVGDVVQVKVPAALIPQWNIQVDVDSMTMNVADAQPLSVLYRSSLKESVGALLANPDAAMNNYLQANTTADGKVAFFAGQWSGTNSSALAGATASFEPSPTNSYYYFTQDVPIYKDQTFTERAKEVKSGETYWYQNDFYKMEGDGSAALMHGSISFSGGTAVNFEGGIGIDANGAYFKAGTARLTYIDELLTKKEANATGTAGDALNPQWNSTTATSAATTVNAHLGNNGKLLMDVPGSLSVTKQIEVPEGYSPEDYADTEFSFTLTVPNVAGKTIAAGVTDSQGAPAAGGATSLSFDADGRATFKLKGGQTLHVYGLADGSVYKVAEGGLPSGWQKGEASGQEGSISAGQTSEAKFTNTYSATGNLGDAGLFIGSKILTGRDWTSNDRFVFQLKATSVSPDAPLPELGVPDGVVSEAGSAYVEVTAPEGFPAGDLVEFDFGDIAYTKPGAYVYEIWESDQASNSIAGKGILPGVSSSRALYQITVKVVDEEHDGTLSVKTEWRKLLNDNGQPIPEEEQDETPGGAVFVNEYDTSTVKWAPRGTKLYTDMTGARDFTRGMFNVALCVNDDVTPLPSGGSIESVAVDGVLCRGAITSVEDGGSIVFPQMEYGYMETGERFQYKIVEVVKDADGNWVAVKDLSQSQLRESTAIPGMTYDSSMWTVDVDITQNGEGVLELATEYSKDGVPQEGSAFSFANTYEPAPARVTVSGSKVLAGRDMLDGESFGFALEAANDAAQSAVPEAKRAEVSGLNAGVERPFEFDELSFAKPGMYEFKLHESAYAGSSVLPADGTAGITFDRHECTVKAIVTDDGSGALKAEVAYVGAGSVEGHPEQFVNCYFAKTDEAGSASVMATKKLTGRPLAEGEFSFAVKHAVGGNDVLTAANAADGTVAFGTLAYDMNSLADLVERGLATKTAAADGKARWTVPYVAYEKTDGLADKGVTAQTQSIPFTVTVTDNGDGTMAAKANVGEGLVFENAYAADAAVVNLAGEKQLQVGEGLQPVDITGKFTFTVTSDDSAAPMPARTSATNDARGTVDFGAITFTLDDLNRALDAAGENAVGAPRSHTFVYKVTESGAVPGVTNDASAVKTVSIKVADNGAGKLTAERVGEAEGPAFTFVNVRTEPAASPDRPEQPGADKPQPAADTLAQTGDNAMGPIIFLMAMAIAGAATLVALLAPRFRTRQR